MTAPGAHGEDHGRAREESKETGAAKLHHYKLTTIPCSPCPCGFWGEGREVEGVGNEAVKSPAASQGQLATVWLSILLQIKKNLRSIESKRLAFSLSSAKINTGKAHCLHRYLK